MKRSKKILLRVIPIVLVLVMVVVSSQSALLGFSEFNTNTSPTAITNTNAVKTVNRVWGIVLTILQVAAIAALVFAGVKYMFTSADQKAEIKKSMSILAVGAILVFGASTVVQFLTGAFSEIAGQ